MMPTRRFSFGQPDHDEAMAKALKNAHSLNLTVYRPAADNPDDFHTYVTYKIEGCFSTELTPDCDPNELAMNMVREFTRRRPAASDSDDTQATA
jgi:hypothetical protein